jgi:hypothetical protein
MAGADPTGGFVGDAFRTAIENVMTLALPNNVQDQPTFRWVVEPTYNQPDPAGQPYYWGATPITDTAIPDLQVTCAVDLSGSPTSSVGTDAGEFTEITARITLLDTDYQTLLAHAGRPPDIVLLGRSTYEVDYIPMNIALFDVDVWEIMCTSRDQAASS